MSKKIKKGKKMKPKTYHRFDTDDKTLEKIAPHLAGQRGKHGGTSKDNRNFINVAIWILRRDIMVGFTALLWEIGGSISKIY